MNSEYKIPECFKNIKITPNLQRLKKANNDYEKIFGLGSLGKISTWDSDYTIDEMADRLQQCIDAGIEYNQFYGIDEDYDADEDD